MAVPDLSSYFAAAPQVQIGGKLIEKVEKYESNDVVRQVATRLFDAWRYYFGFDPAGFHATSAISRGGDQGELAEVRINHSRALVNALLNLIVAPKLVWTPRAANIDYEAVRQTELAAAVLEHYWHDRKVGQYTARAVEEAITFTEGFILLEWDPQDGAIISPTPDMGGVVRTGDIRFSNVSSWDVIRDPTKKSWDELDWVIVRVWRNKYDLAARYPKLAPEILQAPVDLPHSQARTDTLKKWDADDVPVFLFFHRPCAILPWGREVVFLANKTVLSYGNLGYDTIPLHRVSPAELIGTPFGYSAFLEILGIQELSDSIHSSVATNITTFATQCIAVEEGSPAQIDEIAGGMRVLYHAPGKQPPQPLQLTRSPPEAFEYLKALKTYQELLMGLNAVVRGEAQSDKLSGAALALLQSQALQQASALQGNYIRMVEQLGTSVMQIIRRKATAPLKIAIVGRHKLNLVQETEITGADLSSVNQVFVEVGNPISQTAAGRFELAKELIQMQVVRSPEQLQQVLDTGRVDPITQANQEELLNILHENQDMARGEPAVAMLHDNHLLHGKEHTTTVATPAARRNPAVVQAYTDHMHQHYSLYFGVDPTMDPLYRERMLILTGQTPPPPMAPPMPMGPPPGALPPGGPGGPPPGAPPGPGAPPDGAPPPGPPAPAGPAPGAKVPTKPSEPPKNPATGEKWNPVDGGGQVPR